MAAGDSYQLVVRYQAGESEAAATIFERYVERLVALARSRLSVKLRRRVDPEDVVQSAFRSFFLHARDEKYVFQQSGDLWRLLVQITLYKLYGQAERHRAKRRSIAREEVAGDAIVEAAAPEPTPVEVVALIEQLHLITAGLSPEIQTVLTSRLQGWEIEEIAESIHKSPRTVRRLLADVRERIERELASDGDAEQVDREASVRRAIDRRVTLNAADYVLERLLGAGGMGKVYCARERATGRKVAVKALRKSQQGDPRAVEQFVQEAEILATLRHPNIVRVIGLGRFPGGGLFIVMDYVAGANLQERLRRGPLSVRQSLGIVQEVAAAVAHAHEHGIVHADLKPGNVLVDEKNRAVVTDFGFARIVAAAETASRSSLIGGTAGYIAPEVYRFGQVPTVAADIFGLGALLWALVTGSPPGGIRSSNCDEDEILSIEPICRKCLAERPGERYHDVRELLVALVDIQVG